MRLNTFKLRAGCKSIGLDYHLTVLESFANNLVYDTITHRVVMNHNDIPLFFNLTTFGGTNDLGLQFLEEIVTKAIEEFDLLLTEPFSSKHLTYLKNHGTAIFGDTYIEFENADYMIVWQLVDKRIKEIQNNLGDSFVDIYLEFINNTDIDCFDPFPQHLLCNEKD